MANSFTHKDNLFSIGDMIDITYKIKEDGKERQQSFKGVLINIKGKDIQNKMITIRKQSRSGIGVERIIPLSSPYILSIKLIKKSGYRRAKLYFIRNLSDQELRKKLYKSK